MVAMEISSSLYSSAAMYSGISTAASAARSISSSSGVSAVTVCGYALYYSV